MTETEWLTAQHSDSLLRFIGPVVSNRKLFCYDIACARRIAPLLIHPASSHAVDVLERFAEGQCNVEDIRQLNYDVEGAAFTVAGGNGPWQHVAEQLPESLLTDLAANPSFIAQSPRMMLASAAYFIDRIFSPIPTARYEFSTPLVPGSSLFRPVTLVHEVFGNPFRKVKVMGECRTDTVLALAKQMYKSRDFSAMPILADAIQDAGCDNAAVLDHCRGNGPHVRGCWVVDANLGKA